MRPWLMLKIMFHPFQWAHQKIDDWVLGRVERKSDPVSVTRNRVYIIPTRFGWGFSAMCVVMLLGAMNYSNSMAFALTFLLFGLALVCMHHTHANLLNLQLRPGRAKPVFCGEIVHFEVLIDNPAAHKRYSIASGWAREHVDDQTIDVDATGMASVVLTRPAEKRGWQESGIFSISTEFPLGLFHAWTWAHFTSGCLVFPAPAPSGVPPPQTGGTGGTSGSPRAGQDEFAGLRSFQRGDSLRSIHWKSLPKSSTLMVKQFSETVEQALWLDWNSLSSRDLEHRLSQLTRWVLDAEIQGRSYGLRLPGLTIEPSHGQNHQFECLKALALHGLGK